MLFKTTPNPSQKIPPHVYEDHRVFEVDILPWVYGKTLGSQCLRPAPGDDTARQPQRFPWNIPVPCRYRVGCDTCCRCCCVGGAALSSPGGKR